MAAIDIERESITEQTLENEIISDIHEIKTAGIEEIKNAEKNTISNIEQQKERLEQAFSDTKITGIIYKLNQIDNDTKVIYENIAAIAQNTEDEIEDNIRAMIINNGYGINIFNDGYGNVTVEITEVINNG